MDRAQLADFLRTRREALQPEDVGLPRGPRRRTGGLRREEVAALSGMSTDYYGRLEQRRGPQPSEQMLAAMARGLRLSLDERDHLFRLAGHNAPPRALRCRPRQPGPDAGARPARRHPGPGDEPARRDAAADPARGGAARRPDAVHRAWRGAWCTAGSPTRQRRRIYPEEDHPLHSRLFAADLRAAYSRAGTPGSRAAAIVDALLAAQPRVRRAVGRARGRARRGPEQADPASRGGRAGAALPAAARPRPGPGAAGAHRRAGQRELPEAAAALGDRRASR